MTHESSAHPQVSVIIPHYQDLKGLAICLDALDRQTYPADRFEIIIADNNSPVGLDAVNAVVRGRAKVVLVTEKGAGPARNGAVAQSTGEVLAFIDSDCVAEPQWLSEGVAALSRFDLVGGHVDTLVEDPRRVTAAEAFERVFAFDFKAYIEKKGFTGSGNMFCRRTLFDKVGGFRNGVSEDVDWSWRATGMGARLGYAPQAVVGHPARRTWDELTLKTRRVNAEAYGLMTQRAGGRTKWLLRNLIMPASAFAHVPKVLLSPKLSTFGQRLDATGVLFRLRWYRARHAISLLSGSAAG